MAIPIDPATQRAIIALTRSAIEAAVTGQRAGVACLDVGRTTILCGIPEYGGVFVSLYSGDRLRGCIGKFDGTRLLDAALPEVAADALKDPRFVSTPITAADLPLLTVEVSILSPLVDVTDVNRVDAGVHGVVISRGKRSGCLLPQVALARGWDRAAFLTYCCERKAGLAADAWRDPGTRIQVFEVTIMRDERLDAS